MTGAGEHALDEPIQRLVAALGEEAARVQRLAERLAAGELDVPAAALGQGEPSVAAEAGALAHRLTALAAQVSHEARDLLDWVTEARDTRALGLSVIRPGRGAPTGGPGNPRRAGAALGECGPAH